VLFLQVFIKDVGRSIELFFFLALGFYLTVNMAGNFYGRYGIEFMGNIWVNWFGISYFLFVVYIAIMGFLIFKEVKFYNRFLKSKIFWLLFVGSIYIIVVPFLKGENPF
jgi:magnesium-transporting ATPase (P-type)